MDNSKRIKVDDGKAHSTLLIESGNSYPRKSQRRIDIDRVNALSLVSFWWIFDYLFRSFRKKIPEDISINELWVNSIFDSSNVNASRLEHLWNFELKNHPENPSFLRTTFRFIQSRLLLSCLIFLFCIVFGFIGPICLVRGLISFVELPPKSIDGSLNYFEGWKLAFGILSVELLRILAYGATWAISYRTAIRLRSAILSLLYKQVLNARSLRGKTPADVVNIFSNDDQRIFDAVTFAPLVIVGPFVLIGGMVYLLRVLGPLSLVAIGVFLIFDILQGVFGIVMIKCRNAAIIHTEKRINLIAEIISYIREIKLNVWEELFARKVIHVRNQELKNLKTAGYAQSLAIVSGSLVPAISTIVLVLTIVFSGSDLIASDAFSAIAVLSVMLFGIRMIPYGVRFLAEARQAIIRIQELLPLPQYDPIYSSPRDPNIALTLKDCTFSWDTPLKKSPDTNKKGFLNRIFKKKTKSDSNNDKIDVENIPLNSISKEDGATNIADEKNEPQLSRLSHLNFSIRKGELVGICGPVGSGKTSLLNAIIGNLPMDGGDIELTGDIAFCPQTPCILNNTVRENILFGTPMNAQRYYEAINCVQLTHDLERMPSNELSKVSSSELSGGQKSRISLARALYSHRDIFLLDNIFSSIDRDISNKIFQSAFKGSLYSKTVLFITSNAQFLESCDRVLFLESGSLVGNDPHEKLLHSCSRYAQFFESLQSELTFQQKDTSSGESNSETISKVILNKISSKENQEENLGMKNVDPHLYLQYILSGGGFTIFICLMFAFFLSIGSNIFSSFWLSKWMKDVHYGGNIDANDSTKRSHETLSESASLRFYSGIYIAVFVVILLSSLLRAFLFVKFSLSASTRYHNIMLNRILHAATKFFHQTPTGRILNRFSKDIDEMDVKLPFSFEAFLHCILTCIGIIAIIIWVFPIFFILAVPIFCFFTFFIMCFRSGVRLLKRLENLSRSPLLEHVFFSLENLSSIHVYWQTSQNDTKLKALLDENSASLYLYNAAMRWQAIWLDMVVAAITFTVSFLTVWLTGSILPSEAGLAISFAMQLSGTFQFAVRSLTELETRMTSVERISHYCKEIENEKDEPDSTDLPSDWPKSGKIKFENVTLNYNAHSAPSLHGISFEIKDQEKISLSGRTGSGKSSLINALFRLYPIQSGKIFVDSRDISEINLYRLRRSLSVIPQDSVLFSGTIRFNLDPESKHSDDKIWECLNRLQTNQEREALFNQKLEFEVEFGGRNLSSGQKQLICAARSLLRSSKIVVFDEATSNIDMETDNHIQTVLQEFCKEKTVILISHRISNIVQFDRSFKMGDGRLSIEIF